MNPIDRSEAPLVLLGATGDTGGSIWKKLAKEVAMLSIGTFQIVMMVGAFTSLGLGAMGFSALSTGVWLLPALIIIAIAAVILVPTTLLAVGADTLNNAVDRW